METPERRLVGRKGKWTVWARVEAREIPAYDPSLPESYYEQARQHLLTFLETYTAGSGRGSGNPPEWWDPSQNHSFYELRVLDVIGVPDFGVVVFFAFDSDPEARYIWIADTTRLEDLATLDPEDPYLHHCSLYYGPGAAFDLEESSLVEMLLGRQPPYSVSELQHDSIIRIARQRSNMGIPKS